MPLGWGIIGPGRISDTQMAPGINASPDSFLRAVVSRDQGRAEAFAEKHGVGLATTSYAAMLADPEVQCVFIGTPNAQHTEQAILAMRAGKHVLCDKPLALSVADAEAMLRTARECGVKLGTGFMCRHSQGLQAARQVIASGAIGEQILLEATFCSGAGTPASWRLEPEQAGAEALYNVGVHALDLIRFLTGADVSDVMAMNDCKPGDWMDLMNLVLLRFDNGAMAYVNGNQKTPFPLVDLVVHGTKGRIVGVNAVRPAFEGELKVRTEEGETVTPFDGRDAYRREVHAFNRAVIEDHEPDASGLDGLRIVQVSTAILRSAREGVRVKLEY